MKLLYSPILMIFLSLAAFSQQRPLLTEDVETTPAGALEISAGTELQQNAKFPLSGLKGNLTKLGDLRVKLGIGSNVEVIAEGTLQNYLTLDSRTTPSPIPLSISGDSTNDFDDFIIGVKIRMRNESRRFPAIASKFGYQMPNTDQAKGIGTNQVNIFSKVILQKSFGGAKGGAAPVKVFGNIGLGIMSAPLGDFGQNDVMLYGVAAEFPVTERVTLATEVNGRVNTRDEGAPLGTESVGQFRIGARIKASKLSFDFAGLVGLTAYSPRTGITLGVSYLTPRIFPEVD